MRQLDRTKPYAEVHGLPGAVYEQNGIMFRSDGFEASSLKPIIEEIILETSDDVPPPVCCIEQASNNNPETEKPLKDMHWRHLKALVESFGGEWTTREAAIAYIQGDRT